MTLLQSLMDKANSTNTKEVSILYEYNNGTCKTID